MYRVNRKGAKTVLCGAPVLQTIVSETVLCPHILCAVGEVVQYPECEVVIQSHELQLVPQESAGWLVLKALEKSENMILIVLPGFSR